MKRKSKDKPAEGKQYACKRCDVEDWSQGWYDMTGGKCPMCEGKLNESSREISTEQSD
jgi:hypothetical protein